MDATTADQLGTWADEEAALTAYEQLNGVSRPTGQTERDAAIASVSSYLVDYMTMVEEYAVQYTYSFPDSSTLVVNIRAYPCELVRYTP